MQLMRLAIAAALLATSSVAHADETSGTWTGELRGRGNYYWENSTRVVAPEIGVELESPGGVRLRGSYLVDTITSASVAAGARVDIQFTEIRHGASLGVSRELDLGDVFLDLSADATVSYEPDYQSYAGTLGSALSLNDRATVLRLDLTYAHDEVGKKLRGANRVDPMGRDLSDRGSVGSMDALVLALRMSQALSPRLLLEAGYSLGLVYGYQSNAYRLVNVAGGRLDESHPDQRTRHTGSLRLAWYLPATRTALHVLYRAYIDSWRIAALTPEGRVYQELGETAMLRVRYRYYAQTRASFRQDSYMLTDRFWTADPKTESFHSHLLGGQLLLRLGFLEGTFLDFARTASMDISFEYIWNTNSYGNGVIAQVGGRLPF